MKKCVFPIFIMCFVITTGCTEQGKRSSVEELALVSSIGFDLENGEEVRMTVGIPQPAGESPELTEAYSVNTEMIQEGLVDISSQADKMLILNQLRTILFSEEFAKSGRITEVIEHFYRDATIGNKVRLVIVKDQVEGILKADYPENQHMDAYLNDLFQPKLHNSFSPFTSIHDYMNTQTNPVFHTMVPYLEKKEDSLKVTKVAVFNNEKMIDTISTKHSLLIQALKGLEKLAPMAVKFKESKTDKELFLEQIESVPKIRANKNIESPKFSVDLKIKAILIEYKGNRDLSKIGEYTKLENEINKSLEKEVEDILEKFRKLEIDPVGFSEYLRMYHKGKWTDELTQKVIASAEYEVSVKLEIQNTGTLK